MAEKNRKINKDVLRIATYIANRRSAATLRIIMEELALMKAEREGQANTKLYNKLWNDAIDKCCEAAFRDITDTIEYNSDEIFLATQMNNLEIRYNIILTKRNVE